MALGERIEAAANNMPKVGKQSGVRLFQRTLAERYPGLVGTSYPMVWKYISGPNTPSDKFLQAAAKITGVRFEWLKSGQGEMTEGEAAFRRAAERNASATEKRVKRTLDSVFAAVQKEVPEIEFGSNYVNKCFFALLYMSGRRLRPRGTSRGPRRPGIHGRPYVQSRARDGCTSKRTGMAIRRNRQRRLPDGHVQFDLWYRCRPEAYDAHTAKIEASSET